MAESEAKSSEEIIIISDSDDEVCIIAPKEANLQNEARECPICLQKCIHPAILPCGHIFCFLCVKGVAYKNSRCAMCRRDIPPEFLDHPQLVNGIDELKKSLSADEGYQWFYEGRNGWWQYDERTCQELEEAFSKEEKTCSLLIAGFLYTVDFSEMLQYRKNDPSRQRKVKRDLSSIPKKGVAGLRIDSNNSVVSSHIDERPHASTALADNFISPIAVTDAAIRIASDIIDSTLAHVDEIAPSSVDRSNASHDSNRSSSGSINFQSSFEILEQAEEILDLNTMSTSIPTNYGSSYLFSQTIDDFRNLTLRNVVDSSDSDDDNEQIIL